MTEDQIQRAEQTRAAFDADEVARLQSSSLPPMPPSLEYLQGDHVRPFAHHVRVDVATNGAITCHVSVDGTGVTPEETILESDKLTLALLERYFPHVASAVKKEELNVNPTD